jgi:hypothetical protein
MPFKKVTKESQKKSMQLVPSTIQNLQTISLLKPRFEKGKSLIEGFKKRKTVREISSKKLSLQLLSNLLWAACGVNRKKGPFGIPGRTAATASNSQEIDVYVAMKEGTYFYDPFHHKLDPVAAGDLRSLAIGPGQGSFGADAPVRLIYVADVYKLSHTSGYMEPGLLDPEIQKSYYFVDTGIIAGNVYLFAASQGLAAWFHNCNKAALKSKLKLRREEKALFAQTIGYPA